MNLNATEGMTRSVKNVNISQAAASFCSFPRAFGRGHLLQVDDGDLAACLHGSVCAGLGVSSWQWWMLSMP